MLRLAAALLCVYVGMYVLCVYQEKHVQSVLEASQKMTMLTEQKSITKMETTLKNREEQLQKLKERLQDHVSTGAADCWLSGPE